MNPPAIALRAAFLLIVSLPFVACGPRQAGGQVEQYFSYASVPIDLQIEEADIIFAGTITAVSGTHWNQDSGEYWEQWVQDGDACPGLGDRARRGGTQRPPRSLRSRRSGLFAAEGTGDR